NYIFSTDGDLNVAVAHLPAGHYDFYFYGHGTRAEDNSVFQLSADNRKFSRQATASSGTNWSTTNWTEGQQYVLFRQVPIADNTIVRVTASPRAGGMAILNGLQVIPSADEPVRVQQKNISAIPAPEGLVQWWSG